MFSYEWQSNVDYRNNFAPRVAFAYAPRQGSTVLRGGFGIFYDRQPDVIQQQAALYDGTQGHQVVISSPGFPVPFDPASPPLPSLLRVAPGIRNPLSDASQYRSRTQAWPRQKLPDSRLRYDAG